MMGIYLRARFIFAYKKPPVTAAQFLVFYRLVKV